MVFSLMKKNLLFFKLSYLMLIIPQGSVDMQGWEISYYDIYIAVTIILINANQFKSFKNRSVQYGTHGNLIFSLLADNPIFPFLTPLYFLYTSLDEFDDLGFTVHEFERYVRWTLLLDENNCLRKRILNKSLLEIAKTVKITKCFGIYHASTCFGAKQNVLFWKLYFTGVSLRKKPIWTPQIRIMAKISDIIFEKQGYVKKKEDFSYILERMMLVSNQKELTHCLHLISQELNYRKSSLRRLYCFISKNFNLLVPVQKGRYFKQAKKLETQTIFAFEKSTNVQKISLNVESVEKNEIIDGVDYKVAYETETEVSKIEDNTRYSIIRGEGKTSKRRLYIDKFFERRAIYLEDNYLMRLRNTQRKARRKKEKEITIQKQTNKVVLETFNTLVENIPNLKNKVKCHLVKKVVVRRKVLERVFVPIETPKEPKRLSKKEKKMLKSKRYLENKTEIKSRNKEIRDREKEMDSDLDAGNF
jgi:hypothetical protein